MRPELYTKYISIKEKYIYDKIGIYDETSELNRAVAISDAFLVTRVLLHIYLTEWKNHR